MGTENDDRKTIEEGLLRFTGELARFEAGSESIWIDTAREIIKLAQPEQPVAFDPFSGYGAIPAEAARLGCQSVASDLNPVTVLCLKTMLEAVPRHGQEMLELYQKGTEWIKTEAEKRLSKYYPKKDGKYPIAYLWARTVQCEAPNCGAEIPLISQTVIAKGKRKAWIEITGNRETKEVAINVKMGEKIPAGLKVTAGGGHAVCPCCNNTTHKERVKIQGKTGKMGHRLFGVALPLGEREGKFYQKSSQDDIIAYNEAIKIWEAIILKAPAADLIEKFPHQNPREFNSGLYGTFLWSDIFSFRQKLTLYVFSELVKEYKNKIIADGVDYKVAKYVSSALALGISNTVHYNTNVSTWLAEHMISSFITGNAMAMRWDWAEANPLVPSYVGGLDYSYNLGLGSINTLIAGFNKNSESTVVQNDATQLNLPDDSADLFFTDPPYYDVIPYADLSDMSYIWLKRMLKDDFPDMFTGELTPKKEQIVVDPYAKLDGRGDQTPERYTDLLTKSFEEGRRALKPSGIGCVVFAHKGTGAWETLLSSIINAGYTVTASWPIDTERASRMLANGTAALQTSVHLIVRPRENAEGKLSDAIGDWRDVLRELPSRIKSWMKRMASEGVVGADALFACLGPALEIFSRYKQVEKPNGDIVTLREYMEKIWETVSHAALSMLFDDAETEGFESDARVTAIWLWTLSTEPVQSTPAQRNSDEEDDDSEKISSKSKGGFLLDSDSANRIAQSLGANIHALGSIIEVKGDKSRLLSVRERMDTLFKENAREEKKAAKRKKQNENQISLFEEWELQGAEPTETPIAYQIGSTVLDQLHQAMLFFALGRTAMLRKFLTEDGAGRDQRFWKLAQALNALYPQNTDERRWLEGVQAYKKSLSL